VWNITTLPLWWNVDFSSNFWQHVSAVTRPSSGWYRTLYMVWPSEYSMGSHWVDEGLHLFCPQHPGRHRKTPDCQPSEDGAGLFSTSGSEVTSRQYRLPILEISSVLSALPHNSSCDVTKRTQPALLPYVWIQTCACVVSAANMRTAFADGRRTSFKPVHGTL
jgi:hypothetical protein